MDQRRQWIEAVQANPRESISALSRRFGISRKTGYKWIARLRDLDPSDPGAFENASSRPLRQKNSTSEAIVTAIVALRKEHPYWGPKKLHRFLIMSFVGQPFPAVSTVGDILKRHGLVVPRRRRIRWKRPKNFIIETTAPNDTWTVDFKGQFKLGDGSMCYPLTIMDLHSRYLLASTCLKSVHGEPVITEFKRIFELYGLPRRIRSDNGTPFATSGPAGLSMLAALWVKLGIELERIDPGHPEQNGAHERMHLTLKQEAIRERKHTIPEQQIHMDRWRHQYNDLRPHESLAMQTPQSIYESSSVVMPAIVPTPSYDPNARVLRIDADGRIRIKEKNVKIARFLQGESIMLRPLKEQKWLVYFATQLLGFVDEAARPPRLRPHSEVDVIESATKTS